MLTETQIDQIADHHVRAWRDSPRGGGERGLRAHVSDAIREALVTDANKPKSPYGINNPEFIRHCAPEAAYGAD